MSGGSRLRWCHGRSALIVSAAAGLLWMSASPAGATPPAGTIATVAGTGVAGFIAGPVSPPTTDPLSGPHGLTYDPTSGAVFASDTNNCTVDRYDTPLSPATATLSQFVNASGVCVAGLSPLGIPGASVNLNHPHGLAVDHPHNLLYVADRDNHAVEVISLASDTLVNQIPLLPGAPLACPVGVSVDQVMFDLYVADECYDIVWRVPFGGGPVVFAGVGGSSGWVGNGIPATTAELNSPSGIAYDSTPATLYISDAGNDEIRSVTGGTINLVVGHDPAPAPGFSPDGSPANGSPVNTPDAVRVDHSGQLFFDEAGNNLIRTVDAAGHLQTIAGGGPLAPPPDLPSGTPANQALLNSPHSMYRDGRPRRRVLPC